MEMEYNMFFMMDNVFNWDSSLEKYRQNAMPNCKKGDVFKLYLLVVGTFELD